MRLPSSPRYFLPAICVVSCNAPVPASWTISFGNSLSAVFAAPFLLICSSSCLAPIFVNLAAGPRTKSYEPEIKPNIMLVSPVSATYFEISAACCSGGKSLTFFCIASIRFCTAPAVSIAVLSVNTPGLLATRPATMIGASCTPAEPMLKPNQLVKSATTWGSVQLMSVNFSTRAPYFFLFSRAYLLSMSIEVPADEDISSNSFVTLPRNFAATSGVLRLP